MRRARIAASAALGLAAVFGFAADAQRVGAADRGRVRAPESIPPVESYAPLTTSVFEVLSVRSSDRVVRLKGKDGKTADVRVDDHVYDLAKVKTGDKVRVDFFQPDDGDKMLRASGMWPAP